MQVMLLFEVSSGAVNEGQALLIMAASESQMGNLRRRGKGKSQ